VVGLWHSEDAFYYDRLHFASSQHTVSLRIRSLVGLLPLIAVHVIRRSTLCRMPRLAEQLNKLTGASLRPQVSHHHRHLIRPQTKIKIWQFKWTSEEQERQGYGTL